MLLSSWNHLALLFVTLFGCFQCSIYSLQDWHQSLLVWIISSLLFQSRALSNLPVYIFQGHLHNSQPLPVSPLAFPVAFSNPQSCEDSYLLCKAPKRTRNDEEFHSLQSGSSVSFVVLEAATWRLTWVLGQNLHAIIQEQWYLPAADRSSCLIFFLIIFVNSTHTLSAARELIMSFVISGCHPSNFRLYPTSKLIVSFSLNFISSNPPVWLSK